MLKTNELEAYKCFKQIRLKFLGSHKAENVENDVVNLSHRYDVLSCKMSLKVHFLELHLNFFTKSWKMFSMNTANDSIKLLLSLKKRFKGNVLWGCLKITVDLLKGILLNYCINDEDDDCRTFFCCFTVSTSIHFFKLKISIFVYVTKLSYATLPKLRFNKLKTRHV